MTDGAAATRRVWQLLTLGRLDEAERAARAALATEPHDAGLLVALAAVLRTADRPADGLAAADTAVGLAPYDGQAHRIRGLLLSDLGRHGEAVVAVDEAAGVVPHSVVVTIDQAWVLRRACRFDEAAVAARRAVALDPLSADAHVMLAGVRAAQDDRHGARRSYAEALRLDPAHVAARHDLALLDAREHRPVRALRGIAAAGALGPAEPQIATTAAALSGRLVGGLEKVLGLTTVGLGTLGWGIPAGTPSRTVAGLVLAMSAALVGWTAVRLPRGSWALLRAALRTYAATWAAAAVIVLCLATYLFVAVTGSQVAYAALAFVLGLGALALLYAVGVFGALGVRWTYRRVRGGARSG